MSAVRFDKMLRRMGSSDVAELFPCLASHHQQQETAALAPQAINRLFAASSCLPAVIKDEGRRCKGRRSSSVELNESPGRLGVIVGTHKVLQKWKNVVHSGGKEGSTTSKVTESMEATASHS